MKSTIGMALNIMDRITSVRKGFKLGITDVDQIAKIHNNFTIEDIIAILEGTEYDMSTDLLKEEKKKEKKKEK